MPCLQCPISLMQLFGRNSVWKELPYLHLLTITRGNFARKWTISFGFSFQYIFQVYSILVADILPWNPICIKSVWANSLFQAWKVLSCKQAKNCKPMMSKQDFQEHQKMDGHCLHLPFCKIKSCFSTLEIISMAGYGLFLLKRNL